MPKSNLVKVPAASQVEEAIQPVIDKSEIEQETDTVVQEYDTGNLNDAEASDIIDEIERLEAKLDAKRKELGKGIKSTESGVMVPPGKAPSGFVWVYNRGPEKFEWQHNSIVFEIDGHSFGLFPHVIAEHGRRRSLLTIDMLTNRTTYQLALPEDKMYGRPLKRINRIEVIDRSTSADPAQLGLGQKTRVAVLEVDGVAQMLQGRVSSGFSELE